MSGGNSSSTQTIAVLLDTDFAYGRQILQGVEEYARRRPEWRVLALHAMQESLLADLLRRRRLAGVIGALMSDRWLVGLPVGGVPLVNVSDASELRRVDSVVPDNMAIGRLAAQYLLESGVRAYGCLCEQASAAARQRRNGFVAELAAAGREVSLPPPAESYAPDAAWPDWLAGLPRPCAIFCGSDYMARRLIGHLRRMGARVPEEFALVGVGDSDLDSLLAGVPLSSVQLPGLRIGRRAAARLEGLLTAGPSAPVVERLPPGGLVVRASSATAAEGDPLVARALALMSARLAEPPTVAALARACGASRRTLEMRFRRALGIGPAGALRRRRIAHAALLLRETDLSLAAIAEAAGFGSASHLSALFRKVRGITPGAWRRQGTATFNAQRSPLSRIAAVSAGMDG